MANPPQVLLRQLVRAALPLGKGTVLDPFMGAGSTVAAAVAVGYESIGVGVDPAFFRIAKRAIPELALIETAETTRKSSRCTRGEPALLALEFPA